MEFTEQLNLKIGHSDAYLIARISRMEFTGKHDFKRFGTMGFDTIGVGFDTMGFDTMAFGAMGFGTIGVDT